MSYFPRRLSFRGPGAIQYHPDEPLPPEVSDEEREAALDARWVRWDAMDSVVERYGADLGVGYRDELDDAGLRSEEREAVMRGDA